MTNVISLKGMPVQNEPQVDEEMVKILEEQLELARAGQLVGIAVVSSSRTGNVMPRWRILSGGAYGVSAGMTFLQAQLMNFLASQAHSL